MKKLLLPTIIASLFLTGCSTVQMKESADKTISDNLTEAKKESTLPKQVQLSTQIVNKRYIKAAITDYVRGSTGNVSQTLSNVSLHSAFQGLAEQAGYTMVLTSDVDANAKVSIDLRNLSAEEALRQVASAAGYIAVIDKKRNTATLSRWATYTFKVPKSVFKDPESNMSMSVAPAKASSGGSSGGSSSSGGADSSFSLKSDNKSSSDAFKKTVTNLAGEGSTVDISESGFITVRGQAQQLRRVQDYLTDISKVALTQVEVEISLIEVQVDDKQDSGVDWSRIFKPGNGSLSVGLSTASNVTGSVAQIGYTTGSISSVLKMLGQTSNYRIIDGDSRTTLNNSPIVFFKGYEKPYIPEVNATTTTGTSTSTSTSASVEMAQDGIAFNIIPSVQDSSNLSLTVQPMIARLGAEESFPVGSVTLKGFKTDKNLSYNNVMVESGKTFMLSRTFGTRVEESASGAPGVVKTVANKAMGSNTTRVFKYETILLVHPRIIPPKRVDILIGESI